MSTSWPPRMVSSCRESFLPGSTSFSVRCSRVRYSAFVPRRGVRTVGILPVGATSFSCDFAMENPPFPNVNYRIMASSSDDDQWIDRRNRVRAHSVQYRTADKKPLLLFV